MSELPRVSTIRERIEAEPKKEAKYCLMAAYLFCGRVSEIVGKTSPSDLAKTKGRGPTGKHVKLTTFELGSIKEPVAVFTVNTAKRGGKKRNIALPLAPKYEAFTEPLYNYFMEFGNNKVFPFTRQKACVYARKAFEKLTYPIEDYKVWTDGKAELVKAHKKPFRTHALRHLRATELIEDYRFDGIDLSVYGGWSLRSMIGVGSAMSRYAHLDWGRYFPKLLKVPDNFR